MTSCSKTEDAYPNFKRSSLIESRSQITIDLVSAESAYELFALALSEAMSDNEDLREFVKTQTDKDTIRNKEIIVGLVADFDVTSSETFREVINPYLLQYRQGSSSSQDVLEEIMSLSPTIMFKVPDMLLRVDWNISTQIPAVRVLSSSESEEVVTYFAGDELNIDSLSIDEDVFHMVVKNAEKNTLVNQSNYLIYGSDIVLKMFMELIS